MGSLSEVIDCPDCDGNGQAWNKNYCSTCLGFGDIMK